MGNRCNVVVAGNPGVGKSTILNSILGRQHFVSGVSTNFQGVTQEVSQQLCLEEMVMLVDTPGVSEVSRSSENMMKLMRAISMRIKTKVLFIMTAEAGRVKDNDLLLFRLILDHVGEHNRGNVALVVNKVSTGVMLHQASLRRFLRDSFGVNERLIYVIPDYGADTVLLGSLPFHVGNDADIPLLADGTWNEIARRQRDHENEQREFRERQARIEEENRRRLARIQEENAREVARLQAEIDRRRRSRCIIL